MVLAALQLAAPVAARAQQRDGGAFVIAIPPLATVKNASTEAGDTWAIANQIADLIAADLKSTGVFIVGDIAKVRTPSYPEVTAPAYGQWRAAGAKYLLSGFVNGRSDGRLTIGCYVYDVQAGREVTRQGFAVSPADWRRAAHRCADAAYVKAGGGAPMFDSRIAYVAQSGTGESLTKRLAMMDFDGANHSFLTAGDALVITPRLSPKADRIAYASFSGGLLQVRIIDVASSSDRPLVSGVGQSFSPAFSPDGQTVALSLSSGGNTDIVTVDSSGGFPRRLTTAPSIETSPSYSPDGQLIAFTSDRSGSPQLYVMGQDGSNERRVSFGAGSYGSPMWSPDGERIAFTRLDGPALGIGVMNANGSDERILTSGPADEQPVWSPDGSRILFERFDMASGRSILATVPVIGGDARTVPTPLGATDPSWAERQE